jgi:hypothetical protein
MADARHTYSVLVDGRVDGDKHVCSLPGYNDEGSGDYHHVPNTVVRCNWCKRVYVCSRSWTTASTSTWSTRRGSPMADTSAALVVDEWADTWTCNVPRAAGMPVPESFIDGDTLVGRFNRAIYGYYRCRSVNPIALPRCRRCGLPPGWEITHDRRRVQSA